MDRQVIKQIEIFRSEKEDIQLKVGDLYTDDVVAKITPGKIYGQFFIYTMFGDNICHIGSIQSGIAGFCVDYFKKGELSE